MGSDFIVFGTVKTGWDLVSFGFTTNLDYVRSGYNALQLVDTRHSWRVRTDDILPLLF
jgi:hypothetical protein